MWDGPHAQMLSGGRLHLQHGPIDVVTKAWGDAAAVALAYGAARKRFASILGELASELGALRRPVAEEIQLDGAVARRMAKACRPYREGFITPMAAVAGAVADELLDAMKAAAELDKAFVNNGGDIALHLAPGESIRIGAIGNVSSQRLEASAGIVIAASDQVRGVATSGARGRSFSLGIADGATILAADAAAADAAATLVANAVDLVHPGIERAPAASLDPDSDLGDRLVTVNVPALSAEEIARALGSGLAMARRLRAAGHIADAVITLQGVTMALSSPTSIPSEPELEALT